MLKNPYTRIAIAAGLATLITPTIVNKLTVVEMNPADGIRNVAATYGVAGATTAFVYVVLSMALGAPTPAAKV